MTWLAIYGLIKFWLPLATGLGMVLKAYHGAKKGLSTWANTLLDNHMSHIQSAAESASNSLIEMTESNRELATTMKLMREDFHENQKEGIRIQNEILTGIEVLKHQV